MSQQDQIVEYSQVFEDLDDWEDFDERDRCLVALGSFQPIPWKNLAKLC